MITQDLIQIHIPRTGGTALRSVLLDYTKGLPQRPHITLSESLYILRHHIPNAYDPPSFIFVRNPWDWYVSRYFFRRERVLRGKSSTLKGFEPTIQKNELQEFTDHLLLLDDAIKSNRTHPPIYRWITLSVYYIKMSDPKVTYIGKFENLEQDFLSILTNISGQKLDIKFPNTMFKQTNTRHYSTYYTPTTKKLVQSWDNSYIKEFGYTFEEA